MAMLGMDVEAIGQVAVQLDAQAQSVEQVIQTIDNLINQAIGNWHGNDANNFQQNWAGHRGALQAAHNEIVNLAQVARMNVQQQEQVSNS